MQSQNRYGKKLNGDIRALDASEFAKEIAELKKGKLLKSNKIQKLNSFIQKSTMNDLNFQLLRVGGRLRKSELQFKIKYPLLLTKSSNFVSAYLRHIHLSNCYAGPKLIISMTLQKIWFVNGRELARQIVRKCIPCFRFKPQMASQIMADLPKDRVTGIQIFYVTGVDICGPVSVTLKIRANSLLKCI